MNKTLISYLVSILRRAWMRSPERTAALKAARLTRGVYLCAHCKEKFGRKEIQVDHIQEIGKWKTLDEFTIKLFCDVDNLQILCKECHKLKTNKWRKISK